MLIDLLYIDAGSAGVDSFNVLPGGYEVSSLWVSLCCNGCYGCIRYI